MYKNRMVDFENSASEVRNRIKAVLSEKGITQNSVAAGDTAAQKRLNSQLSHGSNLTLDTILRVLDACPDVSADWLLRGSGEKLKTSASITGAKSVTGKNATVIGQQTLSETFVRDLLAEKDKQIQTLLQIMAK